MAGQPLATVEDLGDWLGESITDPADVKRAELCLRAASALVRSETGRTWLSDDGVLEDVPESVAMVTLYCASRVYDNREAQNRWNVDDAGGGWKVDEAGAYLTASEKDILAGFSGRRFGGLGTVSTTRGDLRGHIGGFVPTEDGPPFPWY